MSLPQIWPVVPTHDPVPEEGFRQSQPRLMEVQTARVEVIPDDGQVGEAVLVGQVMAGGQPQEISSQEKG